jgi:hypothetical protein
MDSQAGRKASYWFIMMPAALLFDCPEPVGKIDLHLTKYGADL